MQVVYILRMCLAWPFIILHVGFRAVAEWIVGVRTLARIGLVYHPLFGFRAAGSTDSGWREDVQEAATCARFAITQAADRLSDDLHRAETSVPHETE